jgi:hypothetical protein
MAISMLGAARTVPYRLARAPPTERAASESYLTGLKDASCGGRTLGAGGVAVGDDVGGVEELAVGRRHMAQRSR